MWRLESLLPIVLVEWETPTEAEPPVPVLPPRATAMATPPLSAVMMERSVADKEMLPLPVGTQPSALGLLVLSAVIHFLIQNGARVALTAQVGI